MKKLLTLCTLFFMVALCAHAQKLIAVSEPVNSPGIQKIRCRFSLFNIKADEKGLTLEIVKQKIIGGKYESVSTFFSRPVYNDLEIYNFSPDLKLTGTNKLIIATGPFVIKPKENGNGYEYDTLKSLKIDSAFKKFPGLFPIPNKTNKLVQKNSLFYPYTFDRSVNNYVQSGNEINPKLQCPKDTNQYSPHSTNEDFFDYYNGQFTTLWARKPKNNDDFNYRLKYLTFVNSEPNGKIANYFHINFQYPRLFESAFLVYSPENKNEMIGKVFFFKRPTLLFAKKVSDPVKNNFEIVYCDAGGNLIFHRLFNFGGTKRTSLDVLYATGNSKTLSLFVEYNTDKKGLGFLNFGPDTIYDQKLTPMADFQQKTVAIEKEADVQFFQKREGVFDELHAKKGVGFDFSEDVNYIIGHKLLPNGEIIIYGQRGFKKYLMNTSMAPNDAPPPPPDVKYAEFFALHYNTAHELVSQYISDITITDNVVKYDVIPGLDGKLYFVTSLPKTIINNQNMDERSLESLITKGAIYNYPSKYLYIPKIICINLANRSISSYISAGNGFYLFSPGNFFTYNPDGTFYLIGYTETPDGRVLRAEKVIF